MTEIIDAVDRHPNAIDVFETPSRQAAHAVAGVLRDIDAVKLAVSDLEAVRERLLHDMLPTFTGHKTVMPSEFGAFSSYCATLARLGRKTYRDPFELHDTSEKVADIISRLHKPGLAYLKARPRTQGTTTPDYALGNIVHTTAEVVPDCPIVPIQNKLVLWIRTSTAGKAKTTEVCIDDIAAQLEYRSNTGADTPLVVVGKQAVKKVVEHAYASPRNQRSASGNDSADIFAALCEGGVNLYELGFDKDEIAQQKAITLASLGRVCAEGATYAHEVLMLPPLYNNAEEALAEINRALGDKICDDVHPALGIDYRTLAKYQHR